MIALIMGAIALILYMLGACLAKEYVDTIEEAENDFLPRPFPYWTFVLMWPINVIKSLYIKEEGYE